MNLLPMDVARCGGYVDKTGQVAEECRQCLRRLDTDRRGGPLTWMAPLAERPCKRRIEGGLNGS